MLAAPIGSSVAATTVDSGGLAFGSASPLEISSSAIVGRSVKLRVASVVVPGAQLTVDTRLPGGVWVETVTATTAPDGVFEATWVPQQVGRFELRVRSAAVAIASESTPPADFGQTSFTVYRLQRASWYGPGFFGHRTACGQKLTRRLVGVAHRKLPCGTKIAISYRGKTLETVVVDQGPFVRGVSWDLTQATAQALGISSTTSIGVVDLP